MTPVRLPASFVLPVTLCFLSFFAGKSLFSRQGGGSSSGISASSISMPMSGTSTAQAGLSASAPVGTVAAPNEEILASVMSALTEEDQLRRSHLLHDLLGKLSSPELASFFAHATRVDDSQLRAPLLAAVLESWMSLDPSAASEAIRPYRDSYRSKYQPDWYSVESAVYMAWVQVQPGLAFADAMANPDTRWASYSAYQALTLLAAEDPVRQIETLTHLPPSRLRDQMRESAITLLAKTDYAAAESQLDLITDPRKRALVQSGILKTLADRDPAAGLARLTELVSEMPPGMATSRLVGQVLTAAADRDPALALASVDSLPEALRTQALGSVLSGWARKSPLDALSWAQSKGMDILEAKSFSYYGDSDGIGWNSLVSTAYQNDSTKTLAWVRALPESHQRDRLLQSGIWSSSADEKLAIYSELTPQGRSEQAENIASSLADKEPERAEAWVRDLPEGKARTSAIEGLTNSLAQNSPEKAAEIANAWPAGPDRDAALTGIAYAEDDPQKKMTFVRQIGNPATRELAFESIARSWLWENKTAARAWISTTQELVPWQKRLLLRESEDR